MTGRRRANPAALCLALAAAGLLLGAAVRADAVGPRVFATPEEADRAMIATVKSKDPGALVAFFGPAGQDLVDTSDAATGRRNREVFVAAVAEGWRLGDVGPGRKELVLGNEAWPFPVPLVKTAAGWSFDAQAGREEVLNRRIGRNELAVIRVLQDYVAAQRAYAATGHDGKPAGRYARHFGSDRADRTGSTGRRTAASRAARSGSSWRTLRSRATGGTARGRPRSTATTSASWRARASPPRAAPPNTSSAAR
jgi:hypothetical protein